MGNNEDKTEGIRSSIDDFYSFLPTPGQDLNQGPFENPWSTSRKLSKPSPFHASFSGIPPP